ncbi:hypothetical protein M422DRAFT_29497 [Sphaerobolus stellatus SS14]|uniref:Uncharacterized protein n=1 Tax=Sphaerobolus stellatus (strain SS14) TaxID=990650 RepID=A0A0C9W320_SPHS4|nr:hypothetical protein M422DRAFT_29497 [Sphaerobolus stellatus SS14]
MYARGKHAFESRKKGRNASKTYNVFNEFYILLCTQGKHPNFPGPKFLHVGYNSFIPPTPMS